MELVRTYMKKSIWKNKLNEDQQKEVLHLYTNGKKNIAVLATRYNVGVKQIMEILDNAGIERKRNSKRVAEGWKSTDVRPKFIDVTVPTESYLEYLLRTLALAGQMDGVATENFNNLIQSNPYVGEKRINKRISTDKNK